MMRSEIDCHKMVRIIQCAQILTTTDTKIMTSTIAHFSISEWLLLKKPYHSTVEAAYCDHFGLGMLTITDILYLVIYSKRDFEK